MNENGGMLGSFRQPMATPIRLHRGGGFKLHQGCCARLGLFFGIVRKKHIASGCTDTVAVDST